LVSMKSLKTLRLKQSKSINIGKSNVLTKISN